jgi:orotidine-5'-phosphate decarboxylase
MMHFMQSLQQAWTRNNSLVCVGLDPEPAKFPAHLHGEPDAVFEFCRAIVDATADLVCAFKPQIAHFAALRAEETLERLIAHIHAKHPGVPVILDAKRGDIGSYSAALRHRSVRSLRRRCRHAQSLSRPRFRPAVSRSRRQGRDPALPYVQSRRGRSAGSRRRRQAAVPACGEIIARDWNTHGNCALVTGATWPEQLAEVRAMIGDMPLLVPGIGAQGGDVEAVVRNGRTARRAPA